MGAVVGPRRKRHVFRWVFLGIQVLFLAWVIAGVAGGSGQGAQAHAQAVQYCSGGGWQGLYKSYAQCVTDFGNTLNGAGDTGAAIGAGLVIGLWVAADVILGVTWLVFVRSRWNRYERQLDAYAAAQAAAVQVHEHRPTRQQPSLRRTPQHRVHFIGDPPVVQYHGYLPDDGGQVDDGHDWSPMGP